MNPEGKAVFVKGYVHPDGSVESFGMMYEVRYLGDVEDGLIEILEREMVERRSSDAGHEVLRVLTQTFKQKFDKSWKDNAWGRRGTSISYTEE